jgi:hypothetical protein
MAFISDIVVSFITGDLVVLAVVWYRFLTVPPMLTFVLEVFTN